MTNVTTDDVLAHFGIMGMKWGIRKEESKARDDRAVRAEDIEIPWPKAGIPDLKPNADGSIDIPRGATVQRVANLGRSLGGIGGVELGEGKTYAAFTKGDRLRYEARFGYTKNLFISESSRVLNLTAKEPLKAPNPGDTSAMYYKYLKDNPDALAKVKGYVKSSIMFDEKQFNAALDGDSKSTTAYNTFGALYDSGNYGKRAADGVNEGFHKALNKAGYNMILDPSDSTFGGLYDAPIVILNGSKSLAVTGRHIVTKVSKKEANVALKEYEKVNTGKLLMERLGYDVFNE